MANNQHLTVEDLSASVAVVAPVSTIDEILALPSETDGLGGAGVVELDAEGDGFTTVMGRSHSL